MTGEGSDRNHNALLSEGPPGAAARRAARRGDAEGSEQFCGGFRGPVDLEEALTFPGLSWSLGSFLNRRGLGLGEARSASHRNIALPGTRQLQGRGTREAGWGWPENARLSP